MRAGLKGLKLAVLAMAAIFLGASAAVAKTSTHHHHRHVATYHGHHHYRIKHGRIGYLPRGASAHGRGYRELVGDPGGGVGFYPLPYHYRVGAWRHHMRQAFVPPFIRNGVLYAMTMDRFRYNYWWATPDQTWRYGVYDPYAGVGTPYFAGFYGPAPGDEDVPAFPFGRPYD